MLPGRHLARNRQGRRLASADIENHARRDMSAPPGAFRIDAALEAVPRIRHDAELAPAGRGTDGIEQRDFKEYIRGRVADAGRLAAHDAADRLDAVIVGDHRHGGLQRVFLAVERGYFLAVFGEAHGDVAGDLRDIEDMQRPRKIERDVICDIDQGRDRTQADRAQAVLQPLRAGAVLDAPERAPDNQRARIGRIARQVALPLDGRVETARHFGCIQRFQRAETGGGEIPGDPANTGAVLAVRCQPDFDHRIGQAHGVDRGRADFRIFRQLNDAFVIFGQAHFALGQQHAVRFLTADLARFQRHIDARNIGARRGEHALHPGPRIGRAADDLHRIAVAVIDYADLQAVGIGVAFGGHHMRHTERRERRPAILDAFDLQPDHRQFLDDVFERPVGLEMLLEPGECELHLTRPSATLGTSSGAKP